MQEIKIETELTQLAHEKESLYLYGAGALAQRILDILPADGRIEVKGILVTDISENPADVRGIPVMPAHQHIHEAFVLVAAGGKMRDDMVAYLEKEGCRDFAALDCALEKKLLSSRQDLKKQMREIQNYIWRTTPHPTLQRCIVNIIDHCNLNCAHCDHFSSIASPREIPFAQIDRDLRRLRDLLGDRVGTLRVMGGEPLLHHELDEILKSCREVFPDSPIDIFTNGSLLSTESESFWTLCRDADITLQVTKYPVQIDYEKAEKIAGEFGETVKTLYHEPLDLSGSQDPTRSFMKCSRAVNCSMLSEGRLYPCTMAGCVQIFNEKFGKSIPLTEHDGINLYEMENGDRLLEKLSRPMPICRFCDIDRITRGLPWHTTDQDIREWT